jgi:hypothetical protein
MCCTAVTAGKMIMPLVSLSARGGACEVLCLLIRHVKHHSYVLGIITAPHVPGGGRGRGPYQCKADYQKAVAVMALLTGG